MLQGTGFRIAQGAFSYIQESGGLGNKVAIRFNHNADPYNVEGTRVVGENDQIRKAKLDRWYGGNEDYWNYVPRGDFGENMWRPVAVLEAMYDAWKKGDLERLLGLSGATDKIFWWGGYPIFQFVGNPNDYDGTPTNREMNDYQYGVPSELSDWLYVRFSQYMRRMGNEGSGNDITGSQPPRRPRREPNTVPSIPPTSPSIPPPFTPTPNNPSLPTLPLPADRSISLLLQEISNRLSVMSTQFDSYKQILEEIKVGQGGMHQEVSERLGVQADQLGVLVRRSRPEKGSTGGGGAKGEVKRRNKPA